MVLTRCDVGGEWTCTDMLSRPQHIHRVWSCYYGLILHLPHAIFTQLIDSCCHVVSSADVLMFYAHFQQLSYSALCTHTVTNRITKYNHIIHMTKHLARTQRAGQLSLPHVTKNYRRTENIQINDKKTLMSSYTVGAGKLMTKMLLTGRVDTKRCRLAELQ